MGRMENGVRTACHTKGEPDNTSISIMLTVVRYTLRIAADPQHESIAL